jgi:hypothetical protein
MQPRFAWIHEKDVNKKRTLVAWTQGFYLTHQSLACVFPAFRELHPSSACLEEQGQQKTERIFKNYIGQVQGCVFLVSALVVDFRCGWERWEWKQLKMR